MSGLSDDAKTSKFLSYDFSRYNIEELIQTLLLLKMVENILQNSKLTSEGFVQKNL